MRKEELGLRNSMDKSVENDEGITYPSGKVVHKLSESAPRHFIGDVNITTPSENIQLGSRIVIYGPAVISGVKLEDVVQNKENCSCKLGKFHRKPKIKVKRGKIHTMKSETIKNWNLPKCFLVGLTITLIEIIILSSYFLSSNPVELKNYDVMSTIYEIYSKLPKFVPRGEWGSTHECTYYCTLIKHKTRIKFVITKYIGWYCFLDKSECKRTFEDEFNRNRNDSRYPFNDLYYNYVIGFRGEIFEGRFINCPFDEEFLEKSHFSVVTIGIPYCFPGNSASNKFHTLNVFQSVKQLLNNLRKKDILSKNYVVEFPEICNNSLLLDLITKNCDPVSFYENELFNVSSDWSPEMMRTFLFVSEDNNNATKVPFVTENSLGYSNKSVPSNPNRCDSGVLLDVPCTIYLGSNGTIKNDVPLASASDRKVNYSSASDTPGAAASQDFVHLIDSSTNHSIIHQQHLVILTTLEDPNKASYYSPSEMFPKNDSDKNYQYLFEIPSVNSITVRFTYSPSYFPLDCKQLNDCWTVIKELLNYRSLKRHKINYYVSFRFGGFVVKLREPFYSEKTIKNIVNVGISSSIYSVKFHPYDPVKSLSELLRPIINDVKTSIKYSDIIIEFRCASQLREPKLNFHKVYEMLSDVNYLTKC